MLVFTGPDGIAEWMKSHCQLTARLSKLAVEVKEIRKPESFSWTPGPYSMMTLTFQVFPSENVRSSKPQLDEAGNALKKARTTEGSVSLPLFVGTGNKLLGKFLVEKARALGIPPGKDYGLLKNGQSVELADGRIIEPHEVCEKTEDGVAYMIIHCVDTQDIEATLRCLSKNEAVGDASTLIVHLSANTIVQTPEYRKLINALKGHHIFTQT